MPSLPGAIPSPDSLGTLPAPSGGGETHPQQETTTPHLLPRFSVSNDLKYDAERDLKDIEASHIPVHALNKVGEELPCCSGDQPLGAGGAGRGSGSSRASVPSSQPALPTRGSSYFCCGAAQGSTELFPAGSGKCSQASASTAELEPSSPFLRNPLERAAL